MLEGTGTKACSRGSDPEAYRNACPTETPRRQYRMTDRFATSQAIVLALGCLLTLLSASAPARAEWAGRSVNCDRGQSVARALRFALPGSRIVVRGTCHEHLVIRRDRITLVGLDGAIIDGSGITPRNEGTITILGAQDVTLSGLHVRNGPDQGVAVVQSSRVVLRDIEATGNATAGVVADRSEVRLANVTAADNRGGGFDLFSSSTVVATGPLAARGNGGTGLALNAKSLLELRGAVVTASDNGGDGVLIVNSSDLTILSFPEAQGSGVVTSNNRGNAGMFVANSTVTVVGSNFFGAGNNELTASGNNVGFLLTASNLSSPFANARISAEGNGVGLLLADDSSAFVVGGLTLRGNGLGLLADGAGVVNLQHTDALESSIQGNFGADVNLAFGTRARIQQAIPVGVLLCDPSVLTPLALPPSEPPVYACP